MCIESDVWIRWGQHVPFISFLLRDIEAKVELGRGISFFEVYRINLAGQVGFCSRLGEVCSGGESTPFTNYGANEGCSIIIQGTLACVNFKSRV